jgi:hypothetical protein
MITFKYYHFLITQLAGIASIFFVYIPIIHRFHKTSQLICLLSAYTGVFPGLRKGCGTFYYMAKIQSGHAVRPQSTRTTAKDVQM